MDASNIKQISTFVSRMLLTFSAKGSIYTPAYRNQCIIEDCYYSHENMAETIRGGSTVEGTVTAVSDIDVMIVEPRLFVIQNPRETVAGNSRILLSNKSFSNPGYTRLQLLGEKPKAFPSVLLQHFQNFFEVTPDGLFLSSEKMIMLYMDVISKSKATIRRHGPCISKDANKDYFLDSRDASQTVNMDYVFAFVCKSWPDQKLEWFNRNRKHDWPSSDLVNSIRGGNCHVVPIGDPTSEHPSLEWRFSFLLAERKLVWNFNDTQIQCYFILKLLIQKYINPTVADEVSSYHLKTVVFWQSENLGISEWRVDQLLLRVFDCLSFLSKCVRDGLLEHYFYRSNNLLRHKLRKSGDRKFVLDTLKCVENNLTAKIFEVLPEKDSNDMYSIFGVDNVRQLLNFFRTATLRDYEQLKRVIIKYSEHSLHIYSVLLWVTGALKNVDLLQWALTTLRENPPADVDQTYIEKYVLCIDIRLAIHYCSATLDDSLRKKARKNLLSRSHRLMERGANIDDLVGKLYLATFHFCLKNYSQCENLVRKAIIKRQPLFYAWDSGTSSFIESCKPDLKAIHKYIPGFIDEIVKSTFSLVFSKLDVDFVPHPLKFECALVDQDPYQLFTISPIVYAFALLFMTRYMMTEIGLARQDLDCLAEAVHQNKNLFEIHRAYNLLGYCYLLNGQRNEAISCFISSLKRTRTLPVGIKNAALYHLAILCFEIYTEETSD